MFHAIQEILYFVPDRRAAAEWFSELLGLPVTTLADPDHFFIRVGEQEIWFHAADDKSPVSPGGHVVYWRVPDFDAAVLRAQKLGAILYRGPLNRQDGTWMAQVRCPFGSVVGLIGPSAEREPLTVGAALLRRGWLRRTFRLSGAVSGILECSARRAGIGVDGLSHSGIDILFNLRPVSPVETAFGELKRFSFLVSVGSVELPAHFEIRLAAGLGGLGLLQLEEVRLNVAGVDLYEEKEGKALLQRSPLPIPAAPPDPAASLPRPAQPPDPDSVSLPRPAEPWSGAGGAE